jgi:hypothetical protein
VRRHARCRGAALAGSIVREAVGQSTGNLENAKEKRDEYSEQAGASSSSRQQSQQQKNSRAG